MKCSWPGCDEPNVIDQAELEAGMPPLCEAHFNEPIDEEDGR